MAFLMLENLCSPVVFLDVREFISGASISAYPLNGRFKQAFHTCAQAAPGDLQKPRELMRFLHTPPKGGSNQYPINSINRPRPFKNLVKMNIFAVWSLPTATQRRSGPQHARAERGPRAKCITWKSLKTHRETLRFQCAP